MFDTHTENGPLSRLTRLSRTTVETQNIFPTKYNLTECNWPGVVYKIHDRNGVKVELKETIK